MSQGREYQAWGGNWLGTSNEFAPFEPVVGILHSASHGIGEVRFQQDK